MVKPLKGWQNDNGAIYLNAREVAAMNAAGEQIGVKDQHLLVSAEGKGAPASFLLARERSTFA